MRLGIRSLILAGLISASSMAQDPRTACTIGLYKDTMAPGVVGRMQLDYKPHLRGCIQPIEVSGPKGLKVSLASDGFFIDPQSVPVRAGFLIGPVYRLKVTNIPNEEGVELFPTVEVIDRLYPPSEREHRFPIPIVLEQDDLERASKGDMVTRVVYLEDSEIAEPVSYADGLQRVHELSGTQDALAAADRLGRPMAIIRIGSRVPDAATGVDHQFLYGCPPWVPIKDLPNREKLIESGGWPNMEFAPIVPGETPKANPVQTLEAKRPVNRSTQGAKGRLNG